MKRNTRTIHGKTKTRLYTIYHGMKQRCYNPNNPRYKNYGYRGIGICDEWLTDFMSFYRWSANNGYSDNLTIDRIDNTKGYSPDNCRWITNAEQQNNKRTNVYINVDDEKKTVAQWAKEKGINPKTLSERYSSGISLEHIFDKPDKEERLISYKGKIYRVNDFAKEFNLNFNSVQSAYTKWKRCYAHDGENVFHVNNKTFCGKAHPKEIFRINPDGSQTLFISVKQAAEQSNCRPNNISMCLNGARKHAGGYKWVYANI